MERFFPLIAGPNGNPCVPFITESGVIEVHNVSPPVFLNPPRYFCWVQG